ncbi:hypothetical protein [Rhizobium sp. C1]|uniref:hypothetical protein n=1 Tax=Rhizobium sp. C1 TaxID=1349799 RepID=UPI001E410AD9|nr:hypothetical protein [Rhizobium sp. C1]MCD2176450.1 hypothetical protein [Rhizobium sp. C1]
MAASNDVDRRTRNGEELSFPAAAATLYYGGTIVAVTAAGVAVKPDNGSAVVCVGWNKHRVDNSAGIAGDMQVRVSKKPILIPLAGATAANIGASVYAIDDNTFSLTNPGGKLVCGTIFAVDADGVWLQPK